MSDEERLQRPDPGRTEPLRRWSDLYRRAEVYPAASPADNNGTSNGPGAGSTTNGAGSAVELGYRVIESYLNQGRRMAEQLNGSSYSQRGMPDGVADLVERTVRAYNELLPVWLQVANSLVKVDPLGVRPTEANPARGWPDPSKGAVRTRISVETVSRRPVRVLLDLSEGSSVLNLMTHGVRAVDPQKPVLTEVSFIPAPQGCATLRIVVPDSLPAGHYTGVVVDKDKEEARGTLSIQVSEW
jgi:hypothetical protein